MNPSAEPPALAGLLPSVLNALGASLPDSRDAGGESADPVGLLPITATLQQAVVLLVDGLGHHLLSAAGARAPLFAEAVAGRVGTLRPLLAPFPSTTPTSLVTLGTGRSPGVHGVLGFTLAVPGTDRLLTHIAWGREPNPRQWQPVPRLLEVAAARGVPVAHVSDPAYAGSGLTDAAYGDVPYRGTAAGDERAAGVLAELAAGTRLVCAYHAGLDVTGHRFGVASRQWRAEARRVAALITHIAERLPAGAALIVTADHGMLDVARAPRRPTPVDASAAPRLDIDSTPDLRAGLRLIAGEPRVRYLHTEPGATTDVVQAWRGVLGARASVVERDEAIANEWFGPVADAHRERLGDVIAVCRDPMVLLASAHEPVAVSRLVGFHGAFTEVERTVPMLVLRRGQD